MYMPQKEDWQDLKNWSKGIDIYDEYTSPIWAGVKRATNFTKSGVKKAAFLGGQCKGVHPEKLIAPQN